MDRLILLDSNSLINRAYYALPNLSTHSGQFTGAIFGYMNMLMKIVSTYDPTHIIATFDRKAPTFRKSMYDGYKATRKPMPTELASQLAPLKEILAAMNIPILEMDGYEADDIIGTLAKRFAVETYIVTGDKDSLQLIDDTTTVLLTKKGITEIAFYDEKMLAGEGLAPSQIIDLKSLMGDASDNIPGVAGVGEKTARDLLAKYGTLDGVYAHIDEIKGKLQEKLVNSKDMAYLSYDLATINVHSPVEFDDLDKAKFKPVFSEEVKRLLKALELTKIADRMTFDGEESAARQVEVFLPQVKDIDSLDGLGEVISHIIIKGKFAFSLSRRITVATDEECFNIVIADNLFGEGINYSEFIDAMKGVFESADIIKVCYDLKNNMHVLSNDGVDIVGAQSDVLLKAYLVDANRNYKSEQELFNAYNLPEGEEAALIYYIDNIIDKELEEKNLVKLYQDVELPLVGVLFDMEKQGFSVDVDVLNDLNKKFSAELDGLLSEIMELAGKPFNVNSTQQLASVLFEDLGLKTGKKTKRGYSTNVDVLNSIKNQHPIVPLILRQRELAKLKSTYLDGMLPLIDSKKKIHTVFKQTVTSTGRLSSTEPNLQNIPIRKSDGKLIRKMFVASEGNVLVCADYSQIELRLMAQFSGDKTMIDAFNNNIDIHRTTASKVFGVPIEMVTDEMRRQSKAVNFGIIYGISDFGLSEDLGVPVYMARDFIAGYFATYPKVKEYMDKCVEIAKEQGYVTTYLNRRRDIPELKATNYNVRSFGERVAMNMPLQGSASDIIKVAMLKVHKALKEGGFKAKLIMQVHDELIIDCPVDEEERVHRLLVENMQNITPDFDVKLIADCSSGKSWLEAK
ncbi:MAG: DNA polymerase I [Clostridia bacterium]|jgi:DNA polymerase-1|nr:DNA polymerase I [Clostridia bacterium]